MGVADQPRCDLSVPTSSTQSRRQGDGTRLMPVNFWDKLHTRFPSNDASLQETKQDGLAPSVKEAHTSRPEADWHGRSTDRDFGGVSGASLAPPVQSGTAVMPRAQWKLGTVAPSKGLLEQSTRSNTVLQKSTSSQPSTAVPEQKNQSSPTGAPLVQSTSPLKKAMLEHGTSSPSKALLEESLSPPLPRALLEQSSTCPQPVVRAKASELPQVVLLEQLVREALRPREVTGALPGMPSSRRQSWCSATGGLHGGSRRQSCSSAVGRRGECSSRRQSCSSAQALESETPAGEEKEEEDSQRITPALLVPLLREALRCQEAPIQEVAPKTRTPGCWGMFQGLLKSSDSPREVRLGTANV